MKKHTIIIISVILLLVLVAVISFFRSELGTGLQAFEILRTCIQSPSLSMELSVSARLADTSLNFTALVERSQWEGHDLTTVTKDGNTLCYTGGVILLENGMAYRLTDQYPDYSQLLEQAQALYENVQIEAVDGIYSVTAADADAEAILAILLPGLDVEADALSVELVTEADQLTQLRFRGNLTQSGKECRLTASVEILGTEPTVTIPTAIQEAILGGRLDAAQDLSDDLLRLISAWTDLTATRTIGTAVTLAADCGNLKLQDELMLYRQGNISAIEKYGRMLYFTDSAICDKNGNSISTAEADAVETGKLLDLAWKLCMEGDLSCTRSGPVYTYALTLDEAGMKAVAQAITPKIAELDIGFQSGSILLSLRGDRLESIQLTISGQMDALLVQIPASLSATFTVMDSVTFQIPQAVRNALR